MLRVFLVRHGHYGGQPVPVQLQENENHGGLTALGRVQAQKLGTRFATELFDCIYVTDTPRTQETAEIIVRHNPRSPGLTLLKGLREVQGYHVRPDPLPESTERQALLKNERRLVESCVRRIRKHPAGANILVVAHGTLNCMLAHLLAERDPRYALPLGASNTGVTIIDISKGRRPPEHSPATMQVCNCTRHLDAGELTPGLGPTSH